MVCYLPLLFADGQPACLETITQSQLEKFVPFMLSCCPGYEPGVMPPWWPPDVPFQFPLRPASPRLNGWVESLKSLVSRCYTYYNCEHVLRFCSRLAKFPPTSLIIQDNPEGLVNIYNRENRKLIVTFKKKNQIYDKPQQSSPHKSLLPRRPKSALLPYEQQDPQQHIEDIYLCNYCDEEFTACRDAVAHESLCQGKAAEEQAQNKGALDQEEVMRYFGLCMSKSVKTPGTPGGKRITSLRLSSRSYCSIPVSSPLGRKMMNNATPMQHDDKLHAIAQAEACCSGTPAAPKEKRWPRRCVTGSHWNTTTRRKTQAVWSHSYSFNKWQRAERLKTIATGLNRESRQLLKMCQPCRVFVERLPLLDPAALYAAARERFKSCGIGSFLSTDGSLDPGVWRMNPSPLQDVQKSNPVQPVANTNINQPEADYSLERKPLLTKIEEQKHISQKSTPLTERTRNVQSVLPVAAVIDLCSSDDEEGGEPAMGASKRHVSDRDPLTFRHPQYGVSAVSAVIARQPSSGLQSELIQEQAQVPVSDNEKSVQSWLYGLNNCCGSDTQCVHQNRGQNMTFMMPKAYLRM